MARRRRSFRGFGLPSLSVLSASAKATDILFGAGVGLLAVVATKFIIKQVTPKDKVLPALVQQAAPLIGGLLGGVAAFMLTKRVPKLAAKSSGLLIGSVIAGGALAAHTVMMKNLPANVGYQSYADFGLTADENSYGLTADDNYAALTEGEDDVSLDDMALANMDEADPDELNALLAS